MICAYCGKEFVGHSTGVLVNFCCEAHQRTYRKKFPNKYADMKARAYPVLYFTCAKCGKEVQTMGINDKRSRFCSKICEKRYWKHPPQDDEAHCQNLYLGEIASRANWID